MVIYRIYPDAPTLADGAAQLFADKAAAAQADHGMFYVVLSGGSTPKAMFKRLSAEPYRSKIEWGKVSVFWGDERPVPPKHADSNFKMAREALLRHVPIPPHQVHRMEGERDPQEAAADYEKMLRSIWKDAGHPQFDLIFLGMGDDGHTASLFPHTAALDEKRAWVRANHVPQLDTWRITLTAPAINAARCVAFLVSGESKRVRLHAVLNGEHKPYDQPSQLIKPPRVLIWMLDQDAIGAPLTARPRLPMQRA